MLIIGTAEAFDRWKREGLAGRERLAFSSEARSFRAGLQQKLRTAAELQLLPNTPCLNRLMARLRQLFPLPVPCCNFTLFLQLNNPMKEKPFFEDIHCERRFEVMGLV